MTNETKENHSTYINVPEAVGVFDSFEALRAAFVSEEAIGELQGALAGGFWNGHRIPLQSTLLRFPLSAPR